jgi:hypothetical protein
MKFDKLTKLLVLLIFFITVLPSQLFAHPHHPSDQIGILGLDHIVYGLLFILISFVLLGKFSK